MWRAKSIVHPRFAATSEASFESMLLGTHIWTVYNDSSSCSNSQTYTRNKGSFTVFFWTSRCCNWLTGNAVSGYFCCHYTFLKNWDTPPSVFKCPNLNFRHFCLFFDPPPHFGKCPKFSQFLIMTMTFENKKHKKFSFI